MTNKPKEKEFLRIPDMLDKMGGISRKQFWRLRKKGAIPDPVIASPATWRLKDVDAFYDKRQQRNEAVS